MSQSACLLRSYTHPSYQGSKGDVARALGDSITFGRFLSEPLAWEKWSTFTHNCHLEEAEKFSKQGSVSQMKAYFEAHYKRIRAKKAAAAAAAAAALEEAKAAAKGASQTQVIEDSSDKRTLVLGVNLKSNPGLVVDIPDVKPLTPINIEVDNVAVEEEAKSVTQDAAIDERDIREVADHDVLDSKKNKEAPVASSAQSLDYKRASKLSSSSKPASPIPQNKGTHSTLNCKRNKENNAITNSMKKGVRESEDRKKSTPMSVNCASPAGETSRNSPRFQKIRTSTILAPLVEIPTRAPKIEVPKRSWINSPSENKSRANSTGSGHKSWSPTVCSPFNFRTEQRVAKRKEFFEKLEEKNRMEAEKAFQRKPKGKAENDPMKQRWSSASTLKSPTDSHKIAGQPVDHMKKGKAETDPMQLRWSSSSTLKSPTDSHNIAGQPVDHMKKIQLTRTRSPELERKSNFLTVQDSNAQLCKKPLGKVYGSKLAQGNLNTSTSGSLLKNSSLQENASPNIRW